MSRMKMLVAVVGVAATGFVHGATYTNEVAAGVTQTFSQWEAEKGITIVAGDTIVKKGAGILNPVRAGMVSRAKDYAFSSQNGDKPLPDAPFAGSVPGGGVCVAWVAAGEGGVRWTRAKMICELVDVANGLDARCPPRGVRCPVESPLACGNRA